MKKKVNFLNQVAFNFGIKQVDLQKLLKTSQCDLNSKTCGMGRLGNQTTEIESNPKILFVCIYIYI
jgi:hypothetical protein